MDSPAMSKAAKVESLRSICPSALVILKLLRVGKLLRALAPLFIFPRGYHWKLARIISAKPRVAMAR